MPIAIRGAYQAMPKGTNWPKPGRPPVSVRYGAPLYPDEGETHQAFSRADEPGRGRCSSTRTRSTWWESMQRAEQGETPALAGSAGPGVAAHVGGLAARPARASPDRTWE